MLPPGERLIMFFWIVVLILTLSVLAFAWNKDRKRRAIHSTSDDFGNHSEKRLLEEDHGVTIHGGPGGSAAPATTRQGEGSSISYYSSATNGTQGNIGGGF